jgi:hypothetical protein
MDKETTMRKSRNLWSAVALLAASFGVAAQNPTVAQKRELGQNLTTPVPLVQLIEQLTKPSDANLEWSLGAGPGSGIYWMTNGVGKCYNGRSCRQGYARITVQGRELHNLRQVVEPVYWSILISSTMPAQFPPEDVEIDPKCDTDQCSFDLQSDFINAGYTVTTLCQRSFSSSDTALYALSKNDKTLYIMYASSFGGGGTRNWVKLLSSGVDTKKTCRNIGR